jgi:hypothetical protein
MKRTSLVALCVALGALSCSSGPTPEPQTCDEDCVHESGFRALRETMKLVFNITLQGNPVGEQDETTTCPQGGSARVFGNATSNADIGATEVDLTFELDGCAYLQRDDEPEESYDTTISGTVRESGVLAVQPSATTALLFSGEHISIEGTVFDPPIEYSVEECALEAGQNGNRIGGTLCGREIAFEL